jgi:hypothetical protein
MGVRHLDPWRRRPAGVTLFGMGKVLALATLLAGCLGETSRLEGQDETEQLVWIELYGEDDHPPPPVQWVDRYGPDTAPTGSCSCWGGQALPGQGVWVRYTPRPHSDAPIGLSSYAHELLHYSTWLHTGDADPLHFRADWSLVTEAQSLLIARGL